MELEFGQKRVWSNLIFAVIEKNLESKEDRLTVFKKEEEKVNLQTLNSWAGLNVP